MTSALPEADLAVVLAQLRGMLLSREAATEAVAHLARVARDLVGPAAGAGVSVLEPGEGRITTASTDELVEAADALQYDLDEGPCLATWTTGAAHRLEDTGSDRRWPELAAALARMGVGSMLSVPLNLPDRTVGTLKVYATTAGAFSAHDEAVLTELAAAAATLLGAGQSPDAPRGLTDGALEALADRRTVDVATGVVMERHRLAEDDARRRLLTGARDTGRPLVEHAQQLIADSGRRP